MKFKYTLKIWEGPTPDGEAWQNIDYPPLPGRKIRGGADSIATSDNAAITAASGTWAYLQYPASTSKVTAEEYGINEQLEEIAAAMAGKIYCAEVWRHAYYSQGMPPKRLRGYVSYADTTRRGKWANLDATEMRRRIA